MKPQSAVLDLIEVYAGLKTDKSSGGVIFTLKRENDFALTDEEFYALEKELISDFYKGANEKDKRIVALFKSGDISQKEMEKRLNAGRIKDGAFQQVISNAIRRELNKEVPVNERGFKIIEPTMYDVLSCLTKNDPGTFEDFCSDYGYDSDSRKAERTYHLVVEEWNNVDDLFSDIIDELQEIQ
jgi:hypothetical protein